LTTTFSIIIPTRDRLRQITRLLDSIRKSTGLGLTETEIIVGDNGSRDGTWEMLRRISADFPVPLRLLQNETPGKCRILNEAISMARGDVLAFLDDDVIVDQGWLEAMTNYFKQAPRLAVQGTIRILPEELKDPEMDRLIQRFRTVHQFEYHRGAEEIGTLNGANMAIRREVFTQVGGFDTRLGPGASGTSEDVELAHRIRLAKIKIGYMADAVVYHELNRDRLTEAYFKTLHQNQGRSRLVFKDQGVCRIFFDLCRVSAQFAFYFLFGGERNKYRSKGRVYHYRAMFAAKTFRRHTTTSPR
jgi:glycosyltransferase involved in cell wall biosynthesis